MPLSQHHKGMKIVAANLAYCVGEGYQTLPDKAVPRPYKHIFRRRGQSPLTSGAATVSA
jgi:hypothetical protein